MEVLHSKRLEIRPLLVAEYPAAVEVYRSNPDFMVRISGHPLDSINLKLVEEETKEAAAHGALYCGIFLRGGKQLIGVATFERSRSIDRTAAWIALLLIVGPQQSQGYGTEAYQAVEQFIFIDLSVHSIELGVLPANKSGKEFWKSLGYQEIEPVEPADVSRICLMRKNRR